MGNTDNREIEAKFLDIDVEALQRKLMELGASDMGEELLEERAFDFAGSGPRANRFVRLRKNSKRIVVAYKHFTEGNVDGAEEIEFGVSDLELATLFIQRLGLHMKRQQEQRRHSYQLGDVSFDFNTWPNAPTFLEIEGPSEAAVQQAAAAVGLDWNKAVFENTLTTLVDRFNIPVHTYSIYSFEKIESLTLAKEYQHA